MSNRSVPLIARVVVLFVFIAGLAVIDTTFVGADALQVTCPDGTTLAADGETCLTDAVDDNVTTTTSCLQGVLSDDGKTCIVPRLDTAPPSAAGGTTAGDTTTSDSVTSAPVPSFTG